VGCDATKASGWSIHVGIATEGRCASTTGTHERNDSAAQAALERAGTPAIATADDFGWGRQPTYRACAGCWLQACPCQAWKTLFALVLADRTLSLCAQAWLPIYNWRTL